MPPAATFHVLPTMRLLLFLLAVFMAVISVFILPSMHPMKIRKLLWWGES